MKRFVIILSAVVIVLLGVVRTEATPPEGKGWRKNTTTTTTTSTTLATTTTNSSTTTSRATTTRPTNTGYFSTLPPGSALPSGSTCASLVKPATEVRSRNIPYNNYIAVRGTDYYDPQWGSQTSGMDDRAAAFSARIDGDFTGTTDEIIQWAACKWGFDENIARAVAVTESWWDQRAIGDNGESFGLMQVRPIYHPGTYPAAQKSTAYNVDYTLALRRACYEGWVFWVGQQSPSYGAGDEWGCVGLWFSGRWYDSGAQNYINTVQGHLRNRTWTNPDFLAYG